MHGVAGLTESPLGSIPSRVARTTFITSSVDESGALLERDLPGAIEGAGIHEDDLSKEAGSRV